MSKDSSFHQLHLHSPHHADLHEAFTSSALRPTFEEIFVLPQHQPLNPEDEDDVVPDQHAAFGIQRAGAVMRGERGASGADGTRGEGIWRDFRLGDLMNSGPRSGSEGQRAGGLTSGSVTRVATETATGSGLR